MSNSNLSEFISKVQSDATLSAQFKNIRSDDQLSGMATQLGYSFSSAEVKQCKDVLKSSLLSGSDLDSISGGASVVVVQQWYSGD